MARWIDRPTGCPGAVAVMDLGEPPAGPGRARRPGWWSCRSRTYSSAANRADDISPELQLAARPGLLPDASRAPLRGNRSLALTPGRPVAVSGRE